MDWQVNRYRRGTSELLWNLEVNSDLRQVWESELHYKQNHVENSCVSLPQAPMHPPETYLSWIETKALVPAHLEPNNSGALYYRGVDSSNIDTCSPKLAEMFWIGEHTINPLEQASEYKNVFLWNSAVKNGPRRGRGGIAA